MTFARHSPPAEGFVLAGGGSTRMGKDKALLQLAGRRLIEIALDKLRGPELSLAREPRVAGSRPDLASYAPVIRDVHPGCGPLGGIEAALTASSHPFNVFLAVDLPLLPAKFLKWMLDRAAVTGAWATFPRVSGRAQPLCAIYQGSLLVPISQSVAEGSCKVVPAITAAAAGAPHRRPIDSFDIETIAAAYPGLHDFSPVPLERWFLNLNSPEDLEQALPFAANRWI